MSKARDIASAAPAPSTVSATELGYLDGVTSAIQTQLDAKTAKSTLTTTGDIYYASSANTPARLAIGSTSDVLTVVDGVPGWAAPAGGSTFVGCQLEKITTAQSLTNNTDTAVTFNSEVFDTDGFHDNSTNNSRITIPSGKAGKYLLTAQISFAANAAGVRVIKIFKNGSILMLPSVIAPAPATDFTVINNTTLVDASVGDYFEVFALQSSGGALNLNISQANGVGCFFGATFVGA
jgi:hypothetical protein